MLVTAFVLRAFVSESPGLGSTDSCVEISDVGSRALETFRNLSWA